MRGNLYFGFMATNPGSNSSSKRKDDDGEIVPSSVCGISVESLSSDAEACNDLIEQLEREIAANHLEKMREKGENLDEEVNVDDLCEGNKISRKSKKKGWLKKVTMLFKKPRMKRSKSDCDDDNSSECSRQYFVKSLTGIDSDEILQKAQSYAVFAPMMGFHDERIPKAIATLSVINSLINETWWLVEDVADVIEDDSAKNTLRRVVDRQLVTKCSELVLKYIDLYDNVCEWIKGIDPNIPRATKMIAYLPDATAECDRSKPSSSESSFSSTKSNE